MAGKLDGKVAVVTGAGSGSAVPPRLCSPARELPSRSSTWSPTRPSKPRRRSFPPEFMKEEKPQKEISRFRKSADCSTLNYGARQNLTLSTVVNKRKKPSPFLEDFLMDPRFGVLNAGQSAPTIQVPPSQEIAGPEPDSADPVQLFGPDRENAKAYSRVALWAKSFYPPRPEPLQLSVSAIDTYERCPMKYMFQYVWGIRGGPHAQTTFGNVMHTTIKELVGEIHDRRGISLDEVLAIYEREWSTAGFTDDYHERQYRNAGREQLEAFYKTYSAAPADVLHQEKRFELPLDHEIVVTGRMDQINRLENSTVEIIDYKTGRPRNEKKTGEDLQLSVYALAARGVLGVTPSRLVFYNLATNKAMATSRDAKALAAYKAEDWLAGPAIRLTREKFRPEPGLCVYRW